MPASKEEILTYTMQTILVGASISLMHATHNPGLIMQLVKDGIEVALEKEKANAPATKDQGGD